MPIAKLLAHVYSFHTRLVRLGNRKDIYTAYAVRPDLVVYPSRH
jgi:hypothetical protein